MSDNHQHERAGHEPSEFANREQKAAARKVLAQEIGANLKRAREAQALTIEDVSTRLKVPVIKLMAIEAGALEQLPDLIFAKGVIRSYAKVVQVDVTEALEQMRSHDVAMVLRTDAGLGQTFKPSTHGSPVKWVVWLSGGVIAVLMLSWGGWKLTATSQPVTRPVALQAMTPAMSVSLASVPLAKAADRQAAEPPSVAIETSMVTAVASQVVPASIGVAGEQAGEALRLRFSQAAWVEIRDGNGKVLVSELMPAGVERMLSGQTPLRVLIGNVAGIELLEYGGKPVEIPSTTRGNVARLTLP